jgi:hypothetical protein
MDLPLVLPEIVSTSHGKRRNSLARQKLAYSRWDII